MIPPVLMPSLLGNNMIPLPSFIVNNFTKFSCHKNYSIGVNVGNKPNMKNDFIHLCINGVNQFFNIKR